MKMLKKKKVCDQCGKKRIMADMFICMGKTYCMDCLYSLLLDMAESGNVNIDFEDAEEKGMRVSF